MTEYIGLDVGGTSIRAGGMAPDGTLFYETKVPTYENVRTGEDLLGKLLDLIRAVPDWEQARAVGAGVPGAVDRTAGGVTVADNLTLLNGLPVATFLENALGRPVLLENDARVAALAEVLTGAGAGRETVCYMTISTGLGGAMVQGGRIYHGSRNMGSYLCRMILDGGQNCEALLSGTSLRRRLSAALGRPVDTAGEVFALARAGEPAASAIAEAFKSHLAALFLNLAVTFDPDVIVAGGGVMQAADHFWDQAVARFRAMAHPQLRDTAFARAAHREPGLLGACLLALDEGIIPPTINLKEQDEACDLNCTPNRAVKADITLALSNSLGFGGHNACLAFRKV